jgi:hypothetical protein
MARSPSSSTGSGITNTSSPSIQLSHESTLRPGTVLRTPPSLISNRASIPQGMSPTPRNTRANDLSRSTSLTSTPQRVSSAVAPAGPAPTTRTFTRQTPIRTVVAPKIYPSVSDWERAPTLQVFIARSAANYLSIILDVAVNPTFWGLIIAVFL